MSRLDPVRDTLPPQTTWGRLVAMGGVVIGGLYLLNPGAGVFELIPDNIPLIGNLDEAAAAGLLIFGLRYLGVGIRRAPGAAADDD